jgi:hypothetical protein
MRYNPAMNTRRHLGTAVLICSAALAACSSSGGRSPAGPTTASGTRAVAASGNPSTIASSTSSGHPADAATTKAVAKAYVIFFDANSGVAVSERSLQHGDQLKSALAAQAKTAKQQQLSARVTKVVLLSPNSAAVTFDLLSAGKTLLTDTPGNAAREDGTWKVAARTFCQLVQLTGHPPKACSDPSVLSLPN